MSTYFKAVRPDGTDFYTGTIDYAAALGGEPITLPEVPDPECCTSTVLHASTVPTETLVGGSWPCRLLEVTGTPVAQDGHKRGFFSLAVVREVDAHQALGPQGEQVAALIDRAGKLTVGEAEKLATARATAWDAPWYDTWHAACVAAQYAARAAAWDVTRATARAATWAAAWDATWAAAWDAARGAALALVARDLITKEQYSLLTGPWARVICPAHPDDPTREDTP